MIVDVAQRRTRFIVRDDRFKPSEYEVAPISEMLAKECVTKWHYSGKYVAARRRFGLFRHGIICGVAVYSHPTHNATLTNSFDCPATDAVELGRFALLDEVEFNGESWFGARCREILKREGFAGIVSFADDIPRTNAAGEIVFRGHIGCQYQAGNALFVGRGARSQSFLLPDGSDISPRAVSKARKNDTGADYVCRQLKSFAQSEMPTDIEERKQWFERELKINTRRHSHIGKLKYLWQLDKSVRVKNKILPYPKFSHKLIQPLIWQKETG